MNAVHDMAAEFLKPDLVVHPLYLKSMLRFDLDRYFNIVPLDDIANSVESVKPILVSDTAVSCLNDVWLDPVFNQSMSKRSGIKPHYTSYCFDEKIPLYRTQYRAPRYVVWTTTDNLTICATHVDRIDIVGMHDAYRKAKAWASAPITQAVSIIVFDLDETLIDRDSKKLEYADELLVCARSIYNKVVLYSHGSSLHVDECSAKFDIAAFDLVLSNDSLSPVCNKNLLSLYNYFPNTIFTKATLVDDSLYNWTPEYDKLIVPYKLSSVKHVIPLLK